MSEFAKVCWVADDVLSLRPDWTKEEAEKLLSSYEDTISEMMIERGWNVLGDAIAKWEDDD
jgi:hypothetical protein